MFATGARLLARSAASKFVVSSSSTSGKGVARSGSSIGPKGPTDPKVPQEIAFRLAEIIHGMLAKHGALTVAECWSHAQTIGIKSKRHMKIMLRWMRERKQVKLVGTPANKEESFRYATMYYEPDKKNNWYQKQKAHEDYAKVGERKEASKTYWNTC